jgi:hypothetical protein
MNRNYGLNMTLWSFVISLGGASVLFGACTFLNTVDRFSESRVKSIDETERVAQVNKDQRLKENEIKAKADTQQAYIDNHVNTYDSVAIYEYVCDPNSPPIEPQDGWARYSNPDKKIQVADVNDRVVGEIMPSGNFYFTPDNCK